MVAGSDGARNIPEEFYDQRAFVSQQSPGEAPEVSLLGEVVCRKFEERL